MRLHGLARARPIAAFCENLEIVAMYVLSPIHFHRGNKHVLLRIICLNCTTVKSSQD